jgi:hypothetical protein
MDEETTRLVEAYGLDKEAWRLERWYSYRPRMEALKKRAADGEALGENETKELVEYNRKMAEEEWDRHNDI